VDKDPVGGVERREQESRDTAARRGSLGDIKEDIGLPGVSWVSSEGIPPQAEDWPLPGADRAKHGRGESPTEETTPHGPPVLVAVKRIPKMAKVVLLVLEGERVVRV